MDVLYAAPAEEPLWSPDAPVADANVAWTASASALKERLVADPVDCVVVDPAFAGGDVREVLERVRELRPQVPFVVYGRDLEDETVRHLFATPWTDYVARRDRDDGLELARRVSDLCRAADPPTADRWTVEDESAERSTDARPEASLTVGLDGDVRVASGDVEAVFGASPATLEGRSLDALLAAPTADSLLESEPGTVVTLAEGDGAGRDAEVSVRRTPTGERVTLVFRLRDGGAREGGAGEPGERTTATQPTPQVDEAGTTTGERPGTTTDEAPGPTTASGPQGSPTGGHEPDSATATADTERSPSPTGNEAADRLFEAVFRDPTAPVALLDPDGTIRRHNEAGLDLAGVADGETVGTAYWDLPYWDGTDVSETTVRGYVSRAADGEYVEFETVNRDDDELFAFATSVRPVPDGDGGVEALLVESRDVSDRVRADAERRRKERQFDAVFADPTNGILLLDETGRIERANEVASRAFDDADDVVGLPYWEHPWWDEAEREPSDVRACIERVANGEYVRFETVNESAFDERVAIDVSLRPVYDEDGAVTGMVAQGLDVSGQYRLERNLREERNLTRRILETSPVGIAILTADGEVAFMNERGEGLVGPVESFEPCPLALVGPDGEPIPDEEHPFERVTTSEEPVFGMEVGVELDDETVWLSVNGASLDGGERAVLTFEDVTEQRDRTERLATLAEATQALPRAESPAGVARAALDAAESILGTDSVAVALVDDAAGEDDGNDKDDGDGRDDGDRDEQAAGREEQTTGRGDRLRIVPGSDEALEAHVRPGNSEDDGPGARDSLARRVLDEGEPTVASSVFAVPLGERGVFLADVPGGLETDTRRLVDLFATTVAAELRRADREAALRERTDELASRTTALERLNRVNDVIRTMTSSLLDADSREGVETAACEAFAAADRYAIAWVGQQTVESDRTDLTVSTGAPADETDAADVNELVGVGDSPAVRAVESGGVEVVDDLLAVGDDADASDAGDSPGAPPAWRSFAEAHGLRTSASVPIDRNGTRYGVLTLFGTEPGGFGALEREVLAELGEVMGYAIASIERRQALASDRATELVFSFPVADLQLFPFLRGEAVSMSIRNVVPRGDGRAHLFFDIEGVAPETVLSETADSPGIDRITRLDDADDGAPRFEAVLSVGSPTARLLDRGFVVHDVEVVGDELHLTIRAAVDADPRTVLAEFGDEYDHVELVSKRTCAEPVRNAGSFEAAYLRTLTRRQEEVLRTAHAAGFFEWPRVNSGQDVAKLLGVSQPTVNRHLREAERKLFDQLLDAE